ncbi:MAG: ATP-binding cassette domain-containing protein [Proteobacteria bacterium]|nr:ATP-binding cassette domain-containing protein [Pseudomonadota bacterium]
MIAAHNIHLRYGDRKLFDEVNIKFSHGNCYGLIGANGAGKSTFLKILSGLIEPTSGDISKGTGERLSFLKQDHQAYNQYTVLDTILQGNQELYQLSKSKDELYAKEPFTEEDGLKASEIEAQFAELGGWEAESEAGVLLDGLGVNPDLLEKNMVELSGAIKVKILLAQALFGSPDILLLDEPTNDLDIHAITWLENFLLDFQKTVIVVSHDRHFLNKVCTHMADIDYSRITVYSGNYSFWLEAAKLNTKLRSDQRKKAEDKAKELRTFIARFSANAAKSKQATSRRKILESIDLSSLPVSSRKYPYVHFEQEREAGKDILFAQQLSHEKFNQPLLSDLNFTVEKGEKILILGSELQQSTLLALLAEDIAPQKGELKYGVTTTRSFFPSDHSNYFSEYKDYTLLSWLSQFCSTEYDETYLRSFFGRMLFSGDDVHKTMGVLSGGEKVRCLLAKMMLKKANVLILDNPTAHLDLESITALNEALIQFGGTIIFSSTDHEFIQTIATRILVLDNKGKLAFDKATDYDSYLRESNTTK